METAISLVGKAKWRDGRREKGHQSDLEDFKRRNGVRALNVAHNT